MLCEGTSAHDISLRSIKSRKLAHRPMVTRRLDPYPWSLNSECRRDALVENATYLVDDASESQSARVVLHGLISSLGHLAPPHPRNLETLT